MAVSDIIRRNIEEIRSYTAANEDLRSSAHHFLYDKRYAESGAVQYIVMGINPGEPPSDPNRRAELPLEESSEYSFLEAGSETTSAKKYKRNCEFVCGTDEIALTEALFWSSFDLASLESRYGRFTHSHPHVTWCAKLNKSLIEAHAPKAVIFVGMRFLADIVRLYALSATGDCVYSRSKSNRKSRLIAPYQDEHGRPWVFLKHFAARPSRHEKQLMRDFISRV